MDRANAYFVSGLLVDLASLRERRILMVRERIRTR